MSDDITKDYKSEISKAGQQAEAIYNVLTKTNYLQIDTPTKQYFLHVTEVTPKQSESKVTYDINVAGSGIVFDLNDSRKIIAATVSSSISPDGILMGATVSPDDDPIVRQIDRSVYDDAVNQLASLANRM